MIRSIIAVVIRLVLLAVAREHLGIFLFIDEPGLKDSLISGKVRFIFVVDIYNEGVDIPEVNTVLFLRPTESLTIFLQQLGRGLRLAEDKEWQLFLFHTVKAPTLG